jgi:hypothetical protein
VHRVGGGGGGGGGGDDRGRRMTQAVFRHSLNAEARLRSPVCP